MNIQALFREMHNPSSWRLNMVILPEPYHGFRCDVARIIEPIALVTSKVVDDEQKAGNRSGKIRFWDVVWPELGQIRTLQPILSLPRCAPEEFGCADRRPEHTALDTTRGKSVPGRFLSRRSGLLKEANQFNLLGQEGVVPVGTDHLSVICVSRQPSRIVLRELTDGLAGKSQSELIPTKFSLARIRPNTSSDALPPRNGSQLSMVRRIAKYALASKRSMNLCP